MVATNMKAETMSLMDKRSALEAEMNAIIARLSQPGAPGLSGNLVDSQGFPRSDIDIPVVRAERRRLAELRNDHKEMTAKINQNIQILHSARLGTWASPFKNSGNDDGSDTQISSIVDTVASMPQNVLLRQSPNSMDVDVLVSRPFAMVDEIADASPAVEDGLQLGDQILKFGSVEAGDNLLQRLSSEAQSNLGRAVAVVIMRQGTVINLTITPRTWQGRGLLGCHFRIL
ncbi:26S proteasome non-ATPase regulatory subunit 9 isoform X1 [Abrus precatorius]|uniref:26S proteasome non-ATPase regulatory subunit 9 isoform X1 n=1 Tax=Abrus precatorius TaxID=3816 RepID=A0A8B8K725_ABRPR|nr:26S proteasome non-ATPase regulatory subunit 9 isoform X1 [Abrus precatorius]